MVPLVAWYEPMGLKRWGEVAGGVGAGLKCSVSRSCGVLVDGGPLSYESSTDERLDN